MTQQVGSNIERGFTRFAGGVAKATGRPWAFALCVASVVVWALTGPVLHFSETWQLIINTSTTIVTFLMVFLIQSTQNRDGVALQVKLDELIRSSRARNTFVGIEHLTEAEVDAILAKRKKRKKPAGRAPGRRQRNGKKT